MAINWSEGQPLGINDILRDIGRVVNTRADFISLAQALGIETVVNGEEVPIILPESFANKSLSLTANSVTASPSALSFSADGGTAPVTFTASGTYQLSEIPSWIRTSASFGVNTTIIFFTAIPNNAVNTQNRSGNVKIIGRGNTTKSTLNISQVGNPTIQQISPSGTTELNSQEGTTNIDVTLSDSLLISESSLTNTDGFTITGPTETDLGSSKKYTFVLTRTSTTTERETTFEVDVASVDESYSDTLQSRFVQSGFSPELNIPTSLLDFPQGGDTLSFSFTSNTDWQSVLTGTGFQQSLSQNSGFTTNNITGNGDGTLYVKALTNSDVDRDGRVTLTTTYTSDNVSDFVDLSQDGLPTFQFSNWTGGINILSNGTVQVTNGNAASVSVSPSSFSSVASNTTRNVTCTVTVPSGYSNSTKTVSGTKSDTQPYPPTGQWTPSSKTWSASEGGSGVSRTFVATSNYPIFGNDATLSDTTNFVKNTVGIGNEFEVYPKTTNTGTTTKNATLEFTIYIPASEEFFTYTAYLSHTAASPPTVSISPSSITFDPNVYSTQGLSGVIISTGGGNISQVAMYLEDGPGSSFKLVKRLNDNMTPQTGDWIAYGDNNTSGTYTIGIIPRNSNTTGDSIIDRVRFYASNQGGTGYSSWINITHDPDEFQFSDAGVTGFSVDRNTGFVTAPTSAYTITNRSYSTGYSGGFYPVVTSNTTRSVTVTVQVPSGYSNSNGTVSGTLSTTQLAATEFITLDNGATYSTNIPADGGSTNISVGTQDVYSTSWVSEVNQYINGSNWITLITPSTGIGDGTIQVRAGANWPGVSGYANPREARIRVYKSGNTGIADTILVRQPAGSPPENKPIISSETPSGDISFTYTQFGNGVRQSITYVRQASTPTNDITPNSVSFYMASSDFGFYQTDNNVQVQDMGGIWTTLVTNPAASSFSVGVYPISTNNNPETRTATITFSMANGGGTVSDSKTVSQTGNTLWSLGTLPTLQNSSYSKSALTTFSKNVPYSFDYASENFDKTNFAFYVDRGVGRSITSRNLATATSFVVSKNTNILNSSTTLNYTVGQKVSVQYSVGTATTYGIATITSWNGSTLGVSFITRYGNTTTNYNAWEIHQISGDGSSTPNVYTRKVNEGGNRGTTIRLNDTNDAYGLDALSGTVTQLAGDLTGTLYINSTNQGSIQNAPFISLTSVYLNGFPSPTAYSIGLDTNYATGFTASITTGSSYAGLSTSQDLSGNGAGTSILRGTTREGSSATVFYINLESNTTTRSRTVEVTIEYDDGTVPLTYINITVNGSTGGISGPGDGDVERL